MPLSQNQRRKRQIKALQPVLAKQDSADLIAKQELLNTLKKQIEALKQQNAERLSILECWADGNDLGMTSEQISMLLGHFESVKAAEAALMEHCFQVLQSM